MWQSHSVAIAIAVRFGRNLAKRSCDGLPSGLVDSFRSRPGDNTATIQEFHSFAPSAARPVPSKLSRPDDVLYRLGHRKLEPADAQHGLYCCITSAKTKSIGMAYTRHAYATETKLDTFELFSPEEGLTRIDGCSETGFMVNDAMVNGPLMCLRNTFLRWNVASLASVTPSTLSAACLLVPSPDIIVFGTGRSLQPLPSDTAKRLAVLGISHETCSTVNAMATFNILAQEGRHVVGAFLPLSMSD